MTVAYGEWTLFAVSVDRSDAWEFAEARLSIPTQDGPAGLRRVRGDDQVVCAARGADRRTWASRRPWCAAVAWV